MVDQKTYDTLYHKLHLLKDFQLQPRNVYVRKFELINSISKIFTRICFTIFLSVTMPIKPPNVIMDDKQAKYKNKIDDKL